MPIAMKNQFNHFATGTVVTHAKIQEIIYQQVKFRTVRTQLQI